MNDAFRRGCILVFQMNFHVFFIISSLNKADCRRPDRTTKARLWKRADKMSKIPDFTQKPTIKNKWLPALLHYILIFVMCCEWCSLHPLLFNCDTHTHAHRSGEKAINVLCSFTTSLFVGHAQCWLYCVCSIPLYTRMHSLKHPHLHKVCELLYLSNGQGNYWESQGAGML